SPLAQTCATTIAGRYPFAAQSQKEVLLSDFEKFFGPGGQLEGFFKSQLEPLVNKAGGQWHFKKTGADNPPDSSGTLAQFQTGQMIQDTFFDRTGRAAFEVDAKLVASSKPGDTLYFKLDDKMLMFSLQFDPEHTLYWPPKSGQALTVRSSDDAQESRYPGAWGLFKLVHSGKTRQGSGPEELFTRIQAGGDWFELRLKSRSALNPLQLRHYAGFRCPSAL
ncbi:MAG: hypothetical protein HC848_10515, partial [Limnobacter sp.]|nr:hypothetical protein [Limnobacter sp.]